MVGDIHTVWGASHPRIGALPKNGAQPVQSDKNKSNNA
jgi:hypothetical protein